jgi:preflagellin peptidase FlaK
VSSSLLVGFATGPDLLRLLAVPVFAWAARRDLKARRVPNRTWVPLLVVGAVALSWDLVGVLDGSTLQRRWFAVQVLFSLGVVAPLGYVFWRIGGFGGADAKAIITLAVLFPAYPVYGVLGGTYPVNSAPLGVFSFTVLSNTVLIGLAYPLALAIRNLPRGEFTPAMFIGRPVDIDALTAEYGRLLETPEGFTTRGLDLDALRMYLRWRGTTFEELRSDPDRYRGSVPAKPNDPGDGSMSERDDEPSTGGIEPIEGDPWGADAFLSEHSAYGTTPSDLREGLAVVSEPDRTRVWITPGIPFVVPMFFGLVLALTYGDAMFAAFSVLGLS